MKIEVLEEPLYAGSIACETGAFKKWLKIKHPDVEVVTPADKSKVDLHDYTLVMPLVQLVADASLLNYLNLVLEYSKYYFSASLSGENNKVHIRVNCYDEKSNTIKEFEFDGSESALEKSIEKFDLNKFMEN
uniref:Uncharacterized protein n=1 Tax=Shewanella putrefaciens (strain 200) TaxID=399804 RepID=E6XJR2_SHEP2